LAHDGHCIINVVTLYDSLYSNVQCKYKKI